LFWGNGKVPFEALESVDSKAATTTVVAGSVVKAYQKILVIVWRETRNE
jgi:hypothetical protein